MEGRSARSYRPLTRNARLMNDRDRNMPPDPPADDDYEIEIEPPDETIEAKRRQTILESQEARIDIEEIYREAERDRGGEILQNWIRNFKFRFGLRELLIATAMLALAVALVQLQLFWTAVIVLFGLSVASLYFYLTLQERKHQEEVARKRDEIYAKRREKLAARAPGHIEPIRDATPVEIAPEVSQAMNEISSAIEPPVEREPLRFQFSMRELGIAITVSAILLGLVRFVGGPTIAATLFGAIAIAGLVAFVTRFEPPKVVLFGWWVVLLMYVLLTLLGFVWRHGA
jgi:hypothetical protein